MKTAHLSPIRKTKALAAAALTLLLIPAAFAGPDVISLAGEWKIRLEEPRKGEAGMAQKWFENGIGGTPGVLPGTLQLENIRTPAATRPVVADDSDNGIAGFTTLHSYRGVSWYEKNVEIPAGWQGKHVELFLERCMWETYVWVNGTPMGTRNSLATPQVFDITKALKAGLNRITIAVDNTNSKTSSMSGAGIVENSPADEEVNTAMSRFFNQYDHPDAGIAKAKDVKFDIAGHQLWVSGWNGIVGKVELRASDPLRMVSANAYPLIAKGSVRLKLLIENPAGVKGEATFNTSITPRKPATGKVTEAKWTATLTGAAKETVEHVIKLQEPVLLWDEHTPSLYDARISFSAEGGKSTGLKEIRFGLRELGTKNNQFTVNGKTTFLRGENDALLFPLTVYPPMDVESWRKIMATLKEHGFNHLRFHSCTPPAAAFEAADEYGVYMQVETPMVNTTEGSMEYAESATTDFVSQELRRILDAYGNHPSLFSVSMGNEQGNKLVEFRGSLVKFGKDHDPRRLYAETTGTQARDKTVPLRGSVGDYYITAHPFSGLEPLCGIAWGGGNVLTSSRFNTRPPETVFDYSVSLQGLDKPLVTHEMGQWAVYPDLSEIPNYTGAQRAFNYELIRDRLAAKDMLDLAPEFTRASGKLAAILYKEEVESALRTPGLAGFQMLQMHDYPGQGTATVGMLNSLWESKGLVTPEEFRSFCAPVTPLARLPKRVFTTAETFQASVDLANYGPSEVSGPAAWKLIDQKGSVVASGEFSAFAAPAGTVSNIGKIQAPLASVEAPQKLVLTVDTKVPGQLPNQWDIWVYPEMASTSVPDGVELVKAWDEKSKSLLREGKTVFLVVDPQSLPFAVNTKPKKEDGYKSRAGTFDMPIPGNFTPVFWTMMMKKGQFAQTMGLLLDPKHPALAEFPTESHSNWQWWDPVMKSSVMQLDALPPDLTPIVRVIDNFRYNQRLGMVFEAKVGPGKLLVSSSDLVSDLEKRPAALQLRNSLLSYMGSANFQPSTEAKEEALDKVFLRK